MNLSTKLLVVSVLLAAPAFSKADLVSSYDFEIGNSNLATSPLGTSTNFAAPWASNFMGNVITGAFRDTANDLIAPNFADALATNRYLHFTLTPSEAIGLQTFQVTLGATNSSGSTGYTAGLGVFSSLTGFTAGNELGTDSFFLPAGSGAVDKGTPLTINLFTNVLLQNLSEPVEFRIYYIDDRSTANSSFNVRIRDVSVEAVAIPEPATAGLVFGFLGLLFVVWSFSRRDRIVKEEK
jgi:hypothetical protein